MKKSIHTDEYSAVCRKLIEMRRQAGMTQRNHPVNPPMHEGIGAVSSEGNHPVNPPMHEGIGAVSSEACVNKEAMISAVWDGFRRRSWA